MLKKILSTVVFALAVGAVHAKKDETVSVSGFVKGTPSATKFTVGSRKGEFTVDCSNAKVTYDGKRFEVAKLTGGSQVSITGKLSGKTIKAEQAAKKAAAKAQQQSELEKTA